MTQANFLVLANKLTAFDREPVTDILGYYQTELIFSLAKPCLIYGVAAPKFKTQLLPLWGLFTIGTEFFRLVEGV